MKEIAAALVKAQRAFQPALKTSTNPHFRSRYADLAACVEAVIGALNDSGIALIQLTHEHNDGVIVETTFVHESGETFSAGRLFVPAAKGDPQGFGSALTYARRYSLMAACGHAPEDDDGNAGAAAVRKAAGKIDAKVSPTEEAWKSVDPETQRFLRNVARDVTAAMPDSDKALSLLEMADLDNDRKAALWHLLDSTTRSAIKRAKESA